MKKLMILTRLGLVAAMALFLAAAPAFCAEWSGSGGSGSGYSSAESASIELDTAYLTRPRYIRAGSAITSISRASDIVTVNCSSYPNDNLKAGQTIVINLGSGGSTSFNGAFTIASVASQTQFTYEQEGDDESGTLGTSPVAGGDYTTLTAWEADTEAVPLDLVSAGAMAVAECYNDYPSGLVDNLTIGTHTTDANHYIKVTAPASERNDGSTGTGFRISPSSGSAVTVTGAANVTLEAIEATEAVVLNTDTNTTTDTRSLYTGGLTVSSGATLTLGGVSFASFGSVTLSEGSTAVYTGPSPDDSPGAVTLLDTAHHDITLSPSSTNTFNLPADGFTVNGDITINSSATLDATESDYGMTVAGDWVNNAGSGGFTAQAGTVTLTSGVDHTISGSTTFYDLTYDISADSAERTLTLTAGTTQAISSGGTLTLKGASGKLLTIASSAASVAYLAVNGAATAEVDYVSASYNDASPGKSIIATNSTDAGNNYNWIFDTANINMWTGGTSTDWATDSNWTLFSEPATHRVPISTDKVLIDGTGDYQPVMPASTVTIAGLTISGGSLDAGSSTLTVNGDYSLSGGEFIAPSGTLTVNKFFTKSGGTFTHNDGTVTFGAPNYDSGVTTWYTTTGGAIFYNVNFTNTGYAATRTLLDDMDIDGDLVYNSNSYLSHVLASGTSTVYLAGNFTESGYYNKIFYPDLILNGDSDQTLTQTAGTMLCDITIAKSGGIAKLGSNVNNGNTYDAAGTITINADNTLDCSPDGGNTSYNLTVSREFTNNGTFYGRAGTLSFGMLTNYGTFTSTTGTLTIENSLNNVDGTMTMDNGTVIFSNGYGEKQTVIFTRGAKFKDVHFSMSTYGGTATLLDDMDIDGDLVYNSNSYLSHVLASGTSTVYLAGNFTESGYYNKAFYPDLILNGDSDQTLTCTSGYFKANLIVDKSGGIAKLGSNFGSSSYGTITVNEGNTFDCSPDEGTTSYNLAIASLTNDGTFYGRAGTHSIASLTNSGGTFNGGSSALTATTLTITGGTFNSTSETLQANYFSQSAGTFNGSSGTINTYYGQNGTNSFTLSGTATFNSTTGIFYSSGPFIAPAENFNANGGTVFFTRYNNGSYGTITADGTVFNNVSVGSLAYQTLTITAGTSITVNGLLELFNNYIINGTINAKGDVTVAATWSGGTMNLYINGTDAQAVTFNGGTAPATVVIDNPLVDITYNAYTTFSYLTLTDPGTTFNLGTYGMKCIYFSQAAGTFNGGSGTINCNSNGSSDFTLSGTANYISTTDTLYIGGNFTAPSGTFNANEGTVEVKTINNGGNSTINADGAIFDNLTINKSGRSAYITAETSITVNDLLTLTGNSTNYMGGTINAKGDVSVGPSWGTKNTVFNLSGTSPQTLTGTTTSFTSGQVTILDAAEVQLGANTTVTKLTVDSGGTFDLAGYDFTSTTFVNNGTLKLQGTETATTPTLNTGSIVEYVGGASDGTVKDWPYKTLTFSGAGKTFQWTAGTTYTVATAFNVTGAAANYVNLRSTVSGSTWGINTTGITSTVDYATVKDSVSTIEIIPTNSADAGNNTNWTFSGGATRRIWGGGSNFTGNSYSTATNWTGDTVPTSSEVAVFCGIETTDCHIDANTSVAGLEIGSGYSGTVIQDSTRTLTIGSTGYTQTSGTFSGGDAAMSTSTFSLSGGTFTSTSGTLSVSSTFTVTGGTFAHNEGTVTFGGLTADITTGGITFKDVNFTHSINDTKTLIDDMDIDGNLNYALTSGGAGYIVASGTRTVTLEGNFLTQPWDSRTLGAAGSINLILNGGSDQTFTQYRGNFGANVTVAKTGGVLKLGSNFIISSGTTVTINEGNTLDCSPDDGATSYNLTTTGILVNNGTFYGRAGTHSINDLTNNATFVSTTGILTVNGDFTNNAGDLLIIGDGTVTFGGLTADITTGGITFKDVNFTHSINDTKTLIDDMDIDGNLNYALTSGGAGYIVASGTRTVTLEGNFLTQPWDSRTLGAAGSINLILNGGSDQTFTQYRGNFGANVTVAKTGGVLKLGSNFIISSGTTVTINEGNTLDCSPDDGATSYNLTTTGNLVNNGTFYGRAGTHSIASLTNSGGTFNGGSSALTATTFTLSGGDFTSTSGTLSVASTFTVTGGSFAHNDGTVTFGSVTANITTGGITFNNVRFECTYVTKTLIDDMDIDGSLTLVCGGNWAYINSLETRNIYLAGDYTSSAGGGGMTLGSSGTINLVLNGESSQTLTSAAGYCKANVIVAASSGSAKLGSDFTVTTPGTFTVNEGGTFDCSPDGGTTSYDLTCPTFDNNGTFYGRAGTLTVPGNFTNTSETFIAGNGTVVFSGGVGNVTTNGMTFNDVSFSVYNQRTLIDDMDVDGDMSFESITGWSRVSASGSVTIYLAGDYTQNTPSQGGGGGIPYTGTINLVLNGSTDQIVTITTGSYQPFKANLTVAKTGGSALLGSASTVITPGTTTVDAGSALDLAGYAFTSAAGFTVNGTLKLNGDETFTTPTLGANTTIEYNGTGGPYTIKDWDYYNLIINGPGATFTLPAETTAGGSLTVSAGTLATGNYDLNIGGRCDFTGGAFTAGTSTVTFNGTTAAQKLTSADQPFYGLTVDTAGPGVAVSLADDLTVTNALTLTAGALDLNSATVDLDGAGFTQASGSLLNAGTGSLSGDCAVTGLNVTSGDLSFAPGYTYTATAGSGNGIILPAGSGFVAIRGGASHTVALRSDGTIYTWGLNTNGQLGDNSTTQSLVPVQVLGVGGEDYLTDIVAVAAGNSHTVALKSDGTVYAWGVNDNGQLGDNSTDQSLVPVQVKGVGGDGYLTDIIYIAATINHTVALKSDGTVYAWGRGTFGRLGDGAESTSLVPVQVKGIDGEGYLTDIVSVAAGYTYTVALKSDGTVYAWGQNGNGQLGDDTQINRLVPVQVLGVGGTGYLAGITAISAGQYHTVALKSDGTVYAWGLNGNGQLGDDSTTESHVPVQVKGVGGSDYLTGIASVAAGYTHAVTLNTDGTVYAWGLNTNGQLGDDSTTESHVPVQAKGVGGTGYLTGITGVSAGTTHSVALKSDGTVYAWGRNANGQLGDDSTTQHNAPVTTYLTDVGSNPEVTFTGDSYDSMVTLRSSSPGSTWYYDNAAGTTTTAAYVNVQDSTATTEVTALNSIDFGNNVLWTFDNNTKLWLGSTSNAWSTGSNWSAGTVPAEADIISFNGAYDNDCDIGSSRTVSGVSVRSSYTKTISLGANTLNITGATADFTGGLLNAGTGTVAFAGSTNATFTPSAKTYYNISLGSAGAGILTINGTATVAGDLTQTDGSFADGALDVAGNFIIGAASDGGSATVTLDGSGDQSWTIASGGVPPSGDITIDKSGGTAIMSGITSAAAPLGNIAIDDGALTFSPGTYTFTAGSTLDVGTGTTCNFTGTSLSNMVTLRSASDGSAWNLTKTGTVNADYVDVKDSNASADITATNSADSGGNTHWVIVGQLSSASVTPASVVAGITGDADAVFTTQNAIPATGIITITFPSGFEFDSDAATAASSPDASIDGTLTVTDITDGVVTITRSAGTSSEPGAKTVRLTSVKNPDDTGTTGTYSITTQDSEEDAIDSVSGVTGTAITSGGSLSSTDITPPGNYVAGDAGDSTASFTTVNPIPADGIIEVTYPAGFALDSGGSTEATSQTMDGSLSVSTDGTIATITRSDGTQEAAGAETITLTHVKNPVTGGSTGVYAIKTASASGTTDGLIDQDAAVTEDTILLWSSPGLESTATTHETVSLAWTSPAQTANFDHYEIWYDDASGIDRGSGETEWDDSDDAALATLSTSSTTITGFSTGETNYFKMWAVYSTGGQPYSSEISVQCNTPAIGGYTADNVIPEAQCVQSSIANGRITISFRAKDPDLNHVTLSGFQYSNDGGLAWTPATPGDIDSSGALSTGWRTNGGTGYYSSASDWSGSIYQITFTTQHADVSSDFTGDNGYNNDVRIRFTLNDTIEDSFLPVTSDSFVVDNVSPVGPSSFAVETMTGETAELSWAKATDTTTDGFSYYLYYGTDSDEVASKTASKWDSTKDEGLADIDAVSTTITDLSAGTTYFFMLWGKDRYGNETQTPESPISGDTTGILTGVSAVPASYKSGATGNYDISFTTQNAIPADGYVRITFDADYTFDNPTYNGQPVNVDNNTKTLRLELSQAVDAGGIFSATITGIINPKYCKTTDVYAIFTQDGSMANIDYGETAEGNTISPNDLSGTISVVSDSYIAGDDTEDYTITFTTFNPVASGGKIKVTFDADYDLTGALAVEAGSSHTATVTSSSQDLIITMTEAVDALSEVSMVISGIINPRYEQTTSDYTIYTTTADGYNIDTATAAGQAITYGSLQSPITLTPSSYVAGDVTSYTVAFTTANRIPQDGYLKITFDPAYDLSAAEYSSGNEGSIVTAATNPLYMKIGTAVDDDTGVSIVLSGIKNPEYIREPTTIYALTTIYSDATSFIDRGTADGNVITIGALQEPITVTSPTYVTGDSTQNYTIAFTTANPIPEGGKISVSFDSDYNLTEAAFESGTAGGEAITASVTSAANPLVLTLNSAVDADSAVSLVLSGIKNPTVSQTTSDFTLYTRLADDTNIDTGSANGVTITAGNLTTVSATPLSTKAGALTEYTIAFTTPNPIPSDGKVVITFDADYDLSLSAFESGNEGATITSRADHKITLNVGTAISADTDLSLVFSDIKNPVVTQTTTSFIVDTKDAASAAIDSGSASGISITAGTLADCTVASADLTYPAGDSSQDYNITFITANPIPADGHIKVTFDPDYDLSGAVYRQYPTSSVMGNIVTKADGVLLINLDESVPVSAGSIVYLQVGGIANPGSVQDTDDYAIETEDAASNSYAVIDQGSASGNHITIGQLQEPITVTPLSDKAGAVTSYTIAFTTTSIIPQNGYVQVTFDSGYDLSAAAYSSGNSGTTVTSSDNPLILKLGTAVGADTAVSIVVSGIKNPTRSGQVDDNTITTQTAAGSDINEGTAAGATITTNDVTAATATAVSYGAGDTTTYTFAFNVTNAVPSGGRIKITCDGDYTLTSAAKGTTSHSGTLSINGSDLIFTLSQQITVASPNVSLQISGITNPDFNQTTDDFAIETEYNDSPDYTPIDAGSATGVDIAGRLLSPALTPETTPTAAGSTMQYTISFTTATAVAAGGKVNVNFDTDYDLSGATFSDGNPGSSVTSTANPLVITLGTAMNAEEAQNLTVSGIKNPSVTQTTDSAIIRTRTSEDVIIDAGTADGIAISEGALTAVSVTSPSYIAGDTTQDYTIAFTTVNPVPSGGKVTVEFDADYVLPATPEVTGNTGATAAGDNESHILTITLGTAVNADTAVSLVVPGIKNPPYVQTTGSFVIYTKSASDINIDWSSVAGKDITAGTLAGTSITASSYAAGDSPNYTIAFTTANVVPSGGNIRVTFDSAYNLAGLSTPRSVEAGSSHTANVVASGNDIIITLTQEVEAAANVTMIVSGIKNPSYVKETNAFTVYTRHTNNNANIDYGTSSGVNITANVLTVGTVTADDYKAGATAEYTIPVTLTNALSSGDKIAVTFDDDYTFGSLSVSGDVSGTAASDGQVVTVTLSSGVTADSEKDIILSGTKNPTYVQDTSVFSVTTKAASHSDANIDTGSSSSGVTITANVLTVGTVTADDYKAGATAEYTIPVTLTNALSSGDKIAVTFDDDYTFGSLSVSGDVSGTAASDGQVVTVTLSSGVTADSEKDIILSGTKNPTYVQDTSVFSVTTKAASHSDANIDTGSSSSGVTITANVLTVGTVTADDYRAGVEASYTFPITVTNALVSGDKIVVDLDSDYTFAASQEVSGDASGTADAEDSSITVTLSADLAAGSAKDLIISGIINPVLDQTTDTFTVTSANSAELVRDTGSSAAGVDIVRYLDVTSPALDDDWGVADPTKIITWDSGGDIDTVNIYYSTDQVDWTVIETDLVPTKTGGGAYTPSASCSYTWSAGIPDLVVAAEQDPQVDPSVTCYIKVEDAVTAHGGSPVDVSNAFNVCYYTITWSVKDMVSMSYLTSLSVEEIKSSDFSSTWSVTDKSLSAPIMRNYKYDTYTTTWSKDDYFEKSEVDWVADSSETIVVVMETTITKQWNVHTQYTYDAATDTLNMSVWIDKEGILMLGPTSAEVEIHGSASGGTPVATLGENVLSDANGVFWLSMPAASLTSGQVYFAKTTIDYAGTIYTSGQGVAITIDKKLETISAAQASEVLTQDAFRTATSGTLTLIETATTGTIPTAISDVSTKVDNVGTQVDTVATQVAAVNTNVNTVNTNVSAVQTSVTAILEDTRTNLPATIQSQVVSNLERGVLSEILNRYTIARADDEIEIRYRTATGLAPKMTLYDADGDIISTYDEVDMEEIGSTGIYECPIMVSESWGAGDFTVVCSESTKDSQDSMVLTVKALYAAGAGVEDSIDAIGEAVTKVYSRAGTITSLLGGTEDNKSMSTIFGKVNSLSTTVDGLNLTTVSTDVKNAKMNARNAFDEISKLSQNVGDIQAQSSRLKDLTNQLEDMKHNLRRVSTNLSASTGISGGGGSSTTIIGGATGEGGGGETLPRTTAQDIATLREDTAAMRKEMISSRQVAKDADMKSLNNKVEEVTALVRVLSKTIESTNNQPIVEGWFENE